MTSELLPLRPASGLGKTVTLEDVENWFVRIGDDQRFALGGMMLENRPATLVRALVRSGTSGHFVTSAPTASWDADLLIGLDRVSRVRIPHISFGSLGLAPSVSGRRRSKATFDLVDEPTLIGGYLAAAGRASFQILDHLGRNDVLDDNPQVVRVGSHRAVEPLHTDVALIHAPVGDASGNLVHFGSRYADLLMAQTARTVIAQVDRIVPTAVAARLGITVPGHLVGAVVEAPFAAHPAGSAGAYVADLDHLARYKNLAQADNLQSYVEDFVSFVESSDYNDHVGRDHLARLERQAH